MAADMALILQYGGANQSIVAGLNKMGIPGFERAIVEVQEFRNAFSRQFAGGGKMGSISYSGNYVLGDANGQDQLKTYLKNNTKFADARLYLNYISTNLDSDFLLPDTAQDSVSAWQVVKHQHGEADINGVIPFNGEIVLNGQPVTCNVHYSADTIAFVDSDPDTITDSASGCVAAGFVAGQTIVVEGTTNNDGIYVIDTVAAGTITLTAAGELTAEVAGTTFTLHAGLM